MNATTDKIVDALLEDEDDELDAELAREVSRPASVEDWLLNIGFTHFKMPYTPDESSGFYKEAGQLLINVFQTSADKYRLLYYMRDDATGQWRNVYTGLLNGDALITVLTGRIDVRESQEDDDFEANLSKEVGGNPDEYQEIWELLNSGVLYVSGQVVRRDHHYVHERTTSCDLDIIWEWNSARDEAEEKSQQETEERVEALLNTLESDIHENLIHWNHQIYQELEAAYEDSVSEEVVAGNIEANEYDFDEDGNRDDDGGFKYPQLSPEAQKVAREWWVQSDAETGDTSYAELVEVEWKWLLKNKGFSGVEIAWRGFWSQGDGASFTAKSIDLKKYLEGPDPLTFPECDREQLWEATDDEENLDPKDVYDLNPRERRHITHIQTKADYEEYEARFAEFMDHEGINCLSPTVNEEGDIETNEFSWRPCEVCRRPLGGTRILASGYNPTTKEIQDYKICTDCEYYAAYGTLDDTTMMDLKENRLIRESDDEEDFDPKEVYDDPPPPEPVATFTICSSHGTLTAHVWSGAVTHVERNDPRCHEGDYIDEISAFDVEEWQRTYPNEKLGAGDTIDILDIGFWLKNNEYTGPEPDWREEIRQNREADGMPEG